MTLLFPSFRLAPPVDNTSAVPCQLLFGFEKVQEVSWQPWAPGTIPRRFCSATVLVSDGLWRSLYYAITEDAGMLGVSYGVEFCVVGLDREWSYQPNCVRAKP